jgi:hypothetical protein
MSEMSSVMKDSRPTELALAISLRPLLEGGMLPLAYKNELYLVVSGRRWTRERNANYDWRIKDTQHFALSKLKNFNTTIWTPHPFFITPLSSSSECDCHWSDLKLLVEPFLRVNFCKLDYGQVAFPLLLACYFKQGISRICVPPLTHIMLPNLDTPHFISSKWLLSQS